MPECRDSLADEAKSGVEVRNSKVRLCAERAVFLCVHSGIHHSWTSGDDRTRVDRAALMQRRGQPRRGRAL